MKFDVIISNPPYQLSDGGAQASAKPIYQYFVQKAKKLNPRFLVMIIPSRWMTGGKGLDDFRDEMIHDRHIITLHDFINSADCFSGVDIKGGVCYFLRSRDTQSVCDIFTHTATEVLTSSRYLCEDNDDIFIRDSRMISIKNKVLSFREKSFIDIVSARKPYGLCGDVFKDVAKYGLPPLSKNPLPNGYTLLGLDGAKRATRYIDKNYPLPKREGLDKYKIFMPRNYGCGAIGEVPATPVLATPGMCCTETFLQIGPFNTEIENKNCLSYIRTKFLRFLVGIRKQDQSATQRVYQYVPMQDFTEEWTDEKLYKKYGLTQEEVNYIESVITPME